MLSKIVVEPYFKAVSYLHQTKLMETYSNAIELSTTKPNVLVGPNGSGKSAFLRMLSLLTLSNYIGVTKLSDKYVRWNEELWYKEGPWYSKECKYLHGVNVEGKLNPTFFYHPGFIPGEERCLTTAMMVGFDKESRQVGDLTDKKSSGQAAKNLLNHLLLTLDNTSSYSPNHSSWRYPVCSEEFEGHNLYGSEMSVKALTLVKYLETFDQSARLVVLDEPEQSLDAYEQALLWKRLTGLDCGKIQIVIASHSLHPILNNESFNLIETVPGYVAKVCEVIGL